MSTEESFKPLLPEQAIEYFNDAKEQKKNYLKAVSIRNCLEAIANVVFIHIAKSEGFRGNWERIDLNTKIETLNKFFPEIILESIHYIRITTNKGAHQAGHKYLSADELNRTLENLFRVCEWVIIAYLRKHGLNTHSWIPTVLSTLQPIYRVRILEDLFSNEIKLLDNKTNLLKYLEKIQESHQIRIKQLAKGDFSEEEQKDLNSESKRYENILLIIDKLAMAYIKNGEYEKGIYFIDTCFKDRVINSMFRDQMNEKLQMLQEAIKELPIAKDILQTREYLKTILPFIKKEEYSLFITIFMTIVAQDELGIIKNGKI